MKRLIEYASKAMLVVALALPLTLGTGCVTTTNPDTGEKTIDMVKVEKTATLLKTTVASSLVLALDENPDAATDIKKYLSLTVVVIDNLIANEDYTPGALQDAILGISGDVPPVAKIAMITAIGLYDIYYGDYVTGVVGGNDVAVAFLTAFRDGIKLGIGN